MCGRYTLIRLTDFLNVFPWVKAPEQPAQARYNIAPSQPVLAVTNDGKNRLEFFRWGLVPSWAKDPKIGNKMLNARAETLATNRVYRSAFKRRRCIVPADGFFEWRKETEGKTKTPMYIRRKDQRPFAFAGLWEVWRSDDGTELPTCTVITGEPNALVKPIHDRMPIMLDPDRAQRWLDPHELAAEELMPLLTPYPADQMQAAPVSRVVNSPRTDSPQCIESMTEPEAAPAPKSVRSRKKTPPDQPTLF